MTLLQLPPYISPELVLTFHYKTLVRVPKWDPAEGQWVLICLNYHMQHYHRSWQQGHYAERPCIDEDLYANDPFPDRWWSRVLRCAEFYLPFAVAKRTMTKKFKLLEFRVSLSLSGGRHE